MVTTNVPMDTYVVMHGNVINIDGREVSWVEQGEDPDESEVFLCLRDFVFARNEKAQEVAENATAILRRHIEAVESLAKDTHGEQGAAEPSC